MHVRSQRHGESNRHGHLARTNGAITIAIERGEQSADLLAFAARQSPVVVVIQ